MPRLLRSPILASVLLALLVFAVTLGGTFVYDDVSVVTKDPRLDAPIDWRGLWTGPYNRGVDNLYRPLVSTTYAVQRATSGLSPMPFHAVNWLLQGLVSGMVAWVALRLAERAKHPSPRGVAWVAGLLFAAHPIHVEAAAGIVGRAELMCAAATLGAVGLCLAPTLTRARVFGAFACFVVAMLSKEQGMLVPLIVGACMGSLSLWERAGVRALATSDDTEALTLTLSQREREPEPSERENAALLFVLFMLGTAGMVVLREQGIRLKLWWDRSFLDPWIQPLAYVDGRARAMGALAIAGRYLQLLVAPVTLRLDYGGPIVPGVTRPGDPYLWLGVGAVVLWLGLAGLAWIRRDRLLLAALLAFAVVYGMVGNVVTLIGVNVAERLMYLPSAFFLIAVAALVTRLPRRAWATGLAVVALLFAARSVDYARRWNDAAGLYEYALSVEPRSLKAALLAMQERIERGELDRAEQLGRRAVELDPTYDDPWCRLAMVEMLRGHFAEAERMLAHAQDLQPGGRSVTFYAELEKRRAATRPATTTTTSP